MVLIGACRRIFGNVVGGCYFHSTQSILNRVKNGGLSHQYKTDGDFNFMIREFNFIIRKLCHLGFIEEYKVNERYNLIECAFLKEYGGANTKNL